MTFNLGQYVDALYMTKLAKVRLNVIFFLMFHLVHNLVHPSIDATNKMKGTAKSLLSTVTVKILDSIGIN